MTRFKQTFVGVNMPLLMTKTLKNGFFKNIIPQKTLDL